MLQYCGIDFCQRLQNAPEMNYREKKGGRDWELGNSRKGFEIPERGLQSTLHFGLRTSRKNLARGLYIGPSGTNLSREAELAQVAAPTPCSMLSHTHN